jgi:Protein of unknown function, DUF488
LTQLFSASYRAYRPEMGQAVITSLGLPRWRPEAESWPRAWVLTPTSQLFHLADDDEFTAGYLARLERFGPQKIGRTLEAIARQHEADRLCLLCHEGDWTRCHRSQFAAWWLTTTGELVTEVS